MCTQSEYYQQECRREYCRNTVNEVKHSFCHRTEVIHRILSEVFGTMQSLNDKLCCPVI